MSRERPKNQGSANVYVFWWRKKVRFLTRLYSLPLLLLLSLQGVRYEHRILEGPVSVHILEVDPQHVKIEAAHAEPNVLSLETVSQIAKKEGAYAAVNGGFFRMRGKYTGASSGILKIDGKWLASPRHERAAIGWSRGEKKPLIDRVGWKGSLILQGLIFSLDGINQPAEKENIVLYTSAFSKETLTRKGFTDIQLDKDLHMLALNKSGHTPIPQEGYVVSFGSARTPLFSAEMAQTKLSIEALPLCHPETTAQWNRFDEIVGGTPLLVDRDQVITDYACEKTLIPFLHERHPRTAIGVKSDGHWLFVVVDGRQPHFSVGMTVKELAYFMHELGCSSALNLDGGGSSTLYLDGKVVNVPSPSDEDGKDAVDERPVSDAILIKAKKK